MDLLGTGINSELQMLDVNMVSCTSGVIKTLIYGESSVRCWEVEEQFSCYSKLADQFLQSCWRN
jgi:hypothetical protein